MKAIVIIAILMLFLIGCASSVEEQESMDDAVEVADDVDVREETVDPTEIEIEVEPAKIITDPVPGVVEDTPAEPQYNYIQGEGVDIEVIDARVTRTAGDGTDTFKVEFLVSNIGDGDAELNRMVLRHNEYDNVSRFRYEGQISYIVPEDTQMWVESPVEGEVGSSTDLNAEVRVRIDATRDIDETNDRHEPTLIAARTV